MPAGYLKIRDKLVDEGMSLEAAKTKAAKFYNARRKPGTPPVTRNYEATVAKRKATPAIVGYGRKK